MKNTLSNLFGRQFYIKPLTSLRGLLDDFSFTERLLFFAFVGTLIVSCFFMLLFINNSFLVQIPKAGGSLREGMVESPKFINPLLAVSDTDQDMSNLIYSGLLKATPEGTLVPDMAESYTISSDGLVYTFILKKNLTFHDGTKITANDILFTIQKSQDPILKSPRRASWDGVMTEKIDDMTVRFTLSHPYAPFLQSTTMGILPMHLWKGVLSEHYTFNPLNINPIGSGPFKIKSISKNKLTGTPESYVLVPFKQYTLGVPLIEIQTFFYNNEKELLDAITNGTIDSVGGVTPKNAAYLKINGKLDDKKILSTPLPRTFAVFFNQSQNRALEFKEVRQALLMLTDKKQIVDNVLEGFGTQIDSIIPPFLLQNTPSVRERGVLKTSDPVIETKKLLQSNGWVWNTTNSRYEKKVAKDIVPLTFSLSTSEAPELKATAEFLKADWARAGIPVTIKVFEAADLTANIIVPRKYEALLYGEIVDRGLDFYDFWHSSERKDPGLNIALYTNSTADKLLEGGRSATNTTERLAKYIVLSKEINNDIPAIFIYAPNFIYIIPKELQGVTLGEVLTPSERFLSANRWYLETDNVWKIFTTH